ncbi:winged helix-turn-helix domain-containing protein [Phenylobacterium sp.]|uniref:winged helix-turn-helix domain-containing protein n=1 Tax=Phenylobacterium sp. TaxID=1871053 RepID=UPI0025E8E903|nr:winged helix-turn-helix domain-containing protein [Phenylobacterium sp.]
MDGNTLVATTAAELARWGPFRLGATRIDPASREVKGPGGVVTIEPRVMQVLLVLANAAGGVVTRDDMSRLCWNSQIVGDDALNRAVGEVRRVARTVAAGEFGVETITRTGYRLTGAVIATDGAEAANGVVAPAPRPIPRRLLLGAAAGLVTAGAATYALWPDGRARRAADLAEQAQLALNEDQRGSGPRAAGLLRQAVVLEPRDAALWGKLALACVAMADDAPAAETAEVVRSCEVAAARALSLAPGQPDARTALIMLRASYGDWLAVERGLRAILADAPTNEAATRELAATLQAVGRTHESGLLIDALTAALPLSPALQYRHVYLLWSRDRVGEADRAADRAFALWPRHPGVWFSRLWLMSNTGRTTIALAQIADVESRPEGMPEDRLERLRIAIEAIRTRRPAIVQTAVDGWMADALAGPGAAISAIMILSALGRLDEAFIVADGYMLRRGPSLMPLRPRPGEAGMTDQRRRHSQVFFVPPTAPLRADPRFAALCEACGLADYWRRSGHRPDFLAARAI